MVVSSMYAVKTSQNDEKKRSLEDMTCSGFSDFPFIEDNLNS